MHDRPLEGAQTSLPLQSSYGGISHLLKQNQESSEPFFQRPRRCEWPFYAAPSYPVDNVTRGFRRTDREELDTFFFAAALAFDLCSFALFMSFGAVVRSCLICVGTSCRVPWVCEGQSQEALTVGMDSRMSRIVSDKGEPCCAIEEGMSDGTPQL